MKRLIFPVLTLMCLFSGTALHAQEQARVVTMEEFDQLLHPAGDTTYVINFWATWCKPCVAELPHFEELHAKMADQNVKVVLVSIDFVENREKKLLPFLERTGIQSEVLLFDEPRSHLWIDKVSGEWDGAIPVTLVLNGARGYRAFYNHDFEDYQALKSILDPLFSEK